MQVAGSAETSILDFTRTHFTILAPLNPLLQFQEPGPGSDRRHRRAVPRDVAMRHLVSLSGAAFDPAVIAAVERRYERRDSPVMAHPAVGNDFLSPISAARLED